MAAAMGPNFWRLCLGFIALFAPVLEYPVSAFVQQALNLTQAHARASAHTQTISPDQKANCAPVAAYQLIGYQLAIQTHAVRGLGVCQNRQL